MEGLLFLFIQSYSNILIISFRGGISLRFLLGQKATLAQLTVPFYERHPFILELANILCPVILDSKGYSKPEIEEWLL